MCVCVCVHVRVCVVHVGEPCKTGWTSQGGIWDVDPWKQVLNGVQILSWQSVMCWPIVKYRDYAALQCGCSVPAAEYFHSSAVNASHIPQEGWQLRLPTLRSA